MTQLGFGFDPQRCFGCGACVVACAQSHALPIGVHWRRVHKLPPHAGCNDLEFLSWSCMHCVKPACMEACPAQAYIKRTSDGIVLHIDERCIGCRYCTWACPYGVPQFDRKKGIVTKCDFCVQRLEEGLAPACVETCFAGALIHGTLEELEAAGYTQEPTHLMPEPALTYPAWRQRTLPKRETKTPDANCSP